MGCRNDNSILKLAKSTCPPTQAKTRSRPMELSSEKAMAAYSPPELTPFMWLISKSN